MGLRRAVAAALKWPRTWIVLANIVIVILSRCSGSEANRLSLASRDRSLKRVRLTPQLHNRPISHRFPGQIPQYKGIHASVKHCKGWGSLSIGQVISGWYWRDILPMRCRAGLDSSGIGKNESFGAEINGLAEAALQPTGSDGHKDMIRQELSDVIRLAETVGASRGRGRRPRRMRGAGNTADRGRFSGNARGTSGRRGATVRVGSSESPPKRRNGSVPGWMIADYRKSIQHSARIGDWQAAYSLLEELKDRGGEVDQYMYHPLILSLLRNNTGGYPERSQEALLLALKLSQEMIDCGIIPDASMSSMMISLFGKIPGGWLSALRILDEMIQNGLSPPPMAYTSAVAACGGAYPVAWPAAMGIFQKMTEKGQNISTFTCNALMTTLARAGEWRHAVRLMANMKSKQSSLGAPDVVTYTAMINAHAFTGRGIDAMNTFTEMRQSGISPSFISTCAAIRGCAAGDSQSLWETAFSLYTSLMEKSRGSKAEFNELEARLAVMSVLAKVGRWKMAEDLLREQKKPPMSAFLSVLESYARPGLWQSALDIAREMLSAHNMKLTTYVYRLLIRACNRRKRWSVALSLLSEMRRGSVTVTPGIIAEVMATFHSRYDGWLRALSVVRAVNGHPLEFEELKEVVVETRRLVQLGKSNGWSGTMSMQRVTNTLLELCTDGARWQAAFEIYNYLHHFRPEESENLGAYDRLMAICARAGRPDKAIQVIRLIRREGGIIPPASYFNGIIAAYARRGDWQAALASLEMLLTKGIEATHAGYNAVLSAMASRYQWREAIKLLGLMDTVGVEPDYATYDYLISVCELCGRWERALAYYERMEQHLDYEEFERMSMSKTKVARDFAIEDQFINSTTLARIVAGEIPGVTVDGWREEEPWAEAYGYPPAKRPLL